jgi:hypothetical protein
MTEAEWLGAKDPDPMVQHLVAQRSFIRRQVGRRQLRLFACACCRRVWHLLTDERSRKAVETAERMADGQPDWEEIEEARRHAVRVPITCSAHLALRFLLDSNWHGFSRVHLPTSSSRDEAIRGTTAAEESARQADLLRCIVGNPFRPVRLDPAWLGWNNDAPLRLALAISMERSFERLPILADALEDAGCDQAAVLEHCRSGGDHVHGCWALDLVRGLWNAEEWGWKA